jgi:hypothetical protein
MTTFGRRHTRKFLYFKLTKPIFRSYNISLTRFVYLRVNNMLGLPPLN